MKEQYSGRSVISVLAIAVILLALSQVAVISYIHLNGVSNQADSPAKSSESVSQSQIEKIYEKGNRNTVTLYQTGDVTESQGSGFLSTEGYIITNNHVVGDKSQLDVQYSTGSWTTAEVVGTDPYTDLAVLNPESKPSSADGLEFASETSVSDKVYVIGSPNGLDSSLTSGVVSGKNRSVRAVGNYNIPNMVQTDAALNPGNSGGPMLNKDGEVIAVSQSTLGENIGMGVSYELAKFITDSLIENGNHSHPLLGIQSQNITPGLANYIDGANPNTGVLVLGVAESQDVSNKLNPHTAPLTAEELQANGFQGDIITHIGNKKVTTARDISAELLSNYQGGETVELTILRNGEEMQIEAELGERPPPDENAFGGDAE